MTNKSTIARPYAKAAFEFAREHDAIQSWEDMLKVAQLVVTDPEMAVILTDPRLPNEQKIELMLSICEPWLDQDRRNFLRLVGQNRRFTYLPEILILFTNYRSEYEKKILVHVTSAYPIAKEQQEKLKEALKIRLQRQILLETSVDKKLVGGAVIRAGDFVIDGSVIGQLAKMKQVII